MEEIRKKLEKYIKQFEEEKKKRKEKEKGKKEDIGQLIPPTWEVKIRPVVYLSGRELGLYRLLQAIRGWSDNEAIRIIVNAYLNLKAKEILDEVEEIIKMIKEEGKKKEEEVKEEPILPEEEELEI